MLVGITTFPAYQLTLAASRNNSSMARAVTCEDIKSIKATPASGGLWAPEFALNLP